MDIYPDFRDLLSALNAERVRYLVVGAYAYAFHVEPRFTKDLDIWVEPTPENAQRVWRALREFGAPLADTSATHFTNERLVYQMGRSPVRVDVLMGIDGVAFVDAWAARSDVKLGGVSVHILSREHLIANKRAAARPQDLLDLQYLTPAKAKSPARAKSGASGKKAPARRKIKRKRG